MPFTQTYVQQLMAFMQNMHANSSLSALQDGGVSNTSDRLIPSTEGNNFFFAHSTSLALNPKFLVFSSSNKFILPPPHT
jgi:lipoprotein signal peptidase